MPVKPIRIRVNVPGNPYDIRVEDGLLTTGRAGEVLLDLLDSRRFCIVTHPRLEVPYAKPVAASLIAEGRHVAVVTVRPGERAKSLATLAKLYHAFLTAEMDRTSAVIAVGGGVIGDLAGFAAATYMRGVTLIQAPTTLLAQVDASVGGKTSVNLPAGKNLAGAFHQPAVVLIDPLSLKTLPARELRSGLAEVIKYGIISDTCRFEQVVDGLAGALRRDAHQLRAVIARSCRIKAGIVADDEQDRGRRALLNFGHTIGHAIEAATGFRRYTHGEAVALGMTSAALVGEVVGATRPTMTVALRNALAVARLPSRLPSDLDPVALIELARHDKKSVDGRLRFVLATDFGRATVMDSVPPAAVRAALLRQQSAET